MKHMLFLLSFCLLALHSTAQLEISDDRISVIFHPSMTMEDLTNIQSDLAEQQVVLTIQQTEFSEWGKLTGLSIEVATEEGMKGSASTTLLTRLIPWGFIYDKKGKMPLTTGNLSKRLKESK